MSGTETLPNDGYSKRLRELQAHPGGVEKTSTIDLTDFYGNAETWIVRSIRVDGTDTVFLQHLHSGGGSRLVLPPEVTAAIARQRDGIVGVTRKRAARAGAATRKAKGAK